MQHSAIIETQLKLQAEGKLFPFQTTREGNEAETYRKKHYCKRECSDIKSANQGRIACVRYLLIRKNDNRVMCHLSIHFPDSRQVWLKVAEAAIPSSSALCCYRGLP